MDNSHLIIGGLIVIAVGAAIGIAMIGIGLWMQPKTVAIAPVAVTPSAAQASPAPVATQAVYTTDDIREMLIALGQMQTIVGTNVRGAYEATQYVSLGDLAKDGTSAVIGRLQSIRDAIRQANKDLNRLFFDYRYYDSELRPVLTGYDSALGWMDGSITPIIDDLSKYSSGTSSNVLEALVRDRWIEWSNGTGPHFGKWYGGAEVRIAAETKRIREWPRISQSTEIRSFGFAANASPSLPDPQLLPDDGGPVKWTGGFLLSASGFPDGMNIGGIQATGKNESDEFVGPISGFIRSETTGRQIAFKVDSDKGEEVPLDGYGIPARNQFRIFAPFGVSLSVADFLRDFGRLTFVFQYGNHVYKKYFSPDELETEVERTAKFLVPKPRENKVGARLMTPNKDGQ